MVSGVLQCDTRGNLGNSNKVTYLARVKRLVRRGSWFDASIIRRQKTTSKSRLLNAVRGKFSLSECSMCKRHSVVG